MCACVLWQGSPWCWLVAVQGWSRLTVIFSLVELQHCVQLCSQDWGSHLTAVATGTASTEPQPGPPEASLHWGPARRNQLASLTQLTALLAEPAGPSQPAPLFSGQLRPTAGAGYTQDLTLNSAHKQTGIWEASEEESGNTLGKLRETLYLTVGLVWESICHVCEREEQASASWYGERAGRQGSVYVYVVGGWETGG